MEFPGIPEVAALVIVLVAFYKLFIYPVFLSPLSKIPNAHFLCPVTSLWILYLRRYKHENKTLYNIHKRKGPILRIGPNELAVNTYEGGLNQIYAKDFDKTGFYPRRFNSYGSSNMFTIIDRKEHGARRRVFANVYAKSNVFNSPTARSCARAVTYDRLLPVVQDFASSGKPMEMRSFNYAYSMDSFMAFQFGLSLASNFILDLKQRNWWMKSFYEKRPWLFWTDELPEFTAWIQRLGIRLIPKWADDQTEDLEKWNADLADRANAMLESGEQISPENYPVTFAQERNAFMKQAGKDFVPTAANPYPGRNAILSDSFCHNAAAQETSGDTLTFLYYELSRRPELQVALRKELQSLDTPITYPLPAGSEKQMPDPKALDSLPLLDACLQETLRLHPAVPGAQPRLTPSPSCSLAGYDNIPPGVRVQSHAYTLHRNPDVFPDPEEWKPERWMNATPDQKRAMGHYFWAWGSGPRVCIGSHFATASMKQAIAGIYTNYTTSMAEEVDMEQADGFAGGPRSEKVLMTFRHV